MTNSEIKKFSQNVSSSYHLEDRNKNVPKLRFKGYNDEWVKYQLGKICKTYSGGTPNVSNLNFYNGEIPFIKSGEIHSNQTEMYITEDGLKNSSAKLVNRGDLLFALYGATSGEVDISKIDGAINQAILCVRSNYVNLIFLKEILSFNKNKILCKYLQGGQGNLSADIFKTLKFKFPTLPEQEKIASFLTLIDKKIEKQKELVELLKKYKRGLLSSIFSQKLRFKDNNGNDYPEWEEKRLEEILKIKHGKSQKEIECANGNYPILATGGEIGRTNSCLWDKPCVLIGRKGTIDKPQYMETPFWTVDTLFYSEVFKENNAKYLYYLFNTINWNKYDESTGVPSLSAKTIERIKATVSIRYTEQVTISKILSKLDNKTQQEECMLSNIQTYKKGLLQQMFT